MPLNLAIEARDLGWERYSAKLGEQGGIVEAWVSGDGQRSPSVQMRITPLGDLGVHLSHDQILGGPSGQIFQACTFPANPAYARDIQALALRVGEVLRSKGVLGRFAAWTSCPCPTRAAGALCDRDQPAQGRHDAHVPAAAVPDAGTLPTRTGPSS